MQTFQVPPFTRDESIRLIRRRGRNISVEDANRLAERLGDLPLAIEQAAAWQAASGMPVERYLPSSKHDVDASRRTRRAAIPWTSSPRGQWPSTICVRRRQRRLLSCKSALFRARAHPYRLLWAFQHARDLPPELERIFHEEDDFYTAIRKIGKYALLQVDPGNQTITEHRLVQTVLRERLGEEGQADMVRLVCRLLTAANPSRKTTQVIGDLLSSINRHLSYTGILDQDSPDARRLVIDQIRFLFQEGDHAGSQELAAEAVRRWRVSPGPNDAQISKRAASSGSCCAR